jgi:hypothetical protein
MFPELAHRLPMLLGQAQGVAIPRDAYDFFDPDEVSPERNG